MNILSSASLPEENKLQLRKEFPEDSFIFCNNMTEAENYISNPEVIITYGEDLTKDIIEKAKNLKWVMVIAAGVDKLPFEALNKRNILVTSAKGIHKAPMSEHVLFMMLLIYRKGKTLIDNEKNKVWTRDIFMDEITKKSILILGTGALGKEIAKIAKAFQMETIGISRSGKSTDYFDKNLTIENISTYLPIADFVVSVLPSTNETRYLLNYKHLQEMPNHCVFMNIGRGDVIKEENILKAVRKEEIYHAVLDVFEKEPLPLDHPFWEEENITVTTHLAGVSPHYHNRAMQVFSDNLLKYKNNPDEMSNIIDLTRFY